MFGKKVKLRKIIDKHTDFFQNQGVIPADEYLPSPSPPPPQLDDATIELNNDDCECLISGYFRSLLSNIHHHLLSAVHDQIHVEVIQICLRFIHFGLEPVKFNLFNQKYSTSIYNTILKGSRISSPTNERKLSCHRVFTCSIGYSSGVYRWKVKYEDSDEKSESAPYGGIGIITDNKMLRKENPHGNYHTEQCRDLYWINHKVFGNVIYWDQAMNCVYNYHYGKGKILVSSKRMKEPQRSYRKNDTISMVLNCNRWTLKIFKNGENILREDQPQEIDIYVKNMKYYPVVAFYHHADTYRVLTG
eukprot:CAMPEP_0197036862 /NCGR_PEP_ID=MMETSP1384-20130603/14229_1 /TAXON_ID=29189 /ORGANISM="Ammonia sp." /LENGTH=302 /DNA_ID=CAMNT_0042467085 /DNA_START=33 /DNA_END=941 /DNA_ORIENTATION=-